MGRLIDADELKQDLRKHQIESLIAHAEDKNVFDIINEQPTAYDVEKVVAELKGQIILNNNENVNLARTKAIMDCVKIVRKGGVE